MRRIGALALLFVLPACGRVDSDGTRDDTVKGPPLCDQRLDLNGDGYADLVVPEDPLWEGGGGAPSWRVSIYRGSPTGYLQPEQLGWSESVWGTNLTARLLGDVRGVGTSDVLLEPYAAGAAGPTCVTPAILRGDADAQIAIDVQEADCGEHGAFAAEPTEVDFGDVTGDGRIERLEWIKNANDMVVELVTADEVLLATVTVPATGDKRFEAVGDVTGDGIADAIGMDTLSSSVELTLIAGAPGGLSQPASLATLELPSGRVIQPRLLGDVNGDGAPDYQLTAVATPKYPDTERFLAKSSGLGSFTLESVAGGAWGALRPAGDIQCDGFDDAIARTYDASLPAGSIRLQVYHGGPDGLTQDGSLIVPSGGNGTDVLPVFTPAYARTP